MDELVRSWIKDIEQAINEIYLFVPDPKTYADFQNDIKTRRAVERNISIIGEAMTRILKA